MRAESSKHYCPKISAADSDGDTDLGGVRGVALALRVYTAHIVAPSGERQNIESSNVGEAGGTIA